MTGILAIEHLDLSEKVYVDDCIDKAYGSAVYLKKGTWISNLDLVYGLLLRSGNDCALMLAKSVSNGESEFVELMNKKARDLKMNNTVFSNPHGLDEIDGGNISCSYDMAILQAYALNNDIYRHITSQLKYRSEDYGVWVNKNKLLNQYEFCISGKTGYTKIAKRTLITSAKKNNLELIVVTLNCGGDFAYHKQLYEKHFLIYENRLIIKKGELIIQEYKIFIPNDLYYFVKREIDTKTLVEINKDSYKCKVYVLDEKKTLLGEFEYKEITKAESFFNKFIDRWIDMFI
jgi:D-alanyl-D-alanine carboxypeptidase